MEPAFTVPEHTSPARPMDRIGPVRRGLKVFLGREGSYAPTSVPKVNTPSSKE
jgi:hypothetical protein